MKEKKDNLSKEIKDLPGFSANKTVCIWVVTAEDPTVKSGKRFFVTTKLDRDSDQVLSFIGFEIKFTNVNKIKTYADAKNEFNKSNTDIIFMIYPWNRIINVCNVTYKTKV